MDREALSNGHMRGTLIADEKIWGIYSQAFLDFRVSLSRESSILG